MTSALSLSFALFVLRDVVADVQQQQQEALVRNLDGIINSHPLVEPKDSTFMWQS